MTHNFVARYAIEAMGGLAVVLTYAMGTLFLDRREPALLAAFLMVAALAVSQVRHTGAIGTTVHEFLRRRWLSGCPIAVSHPFTFMSMRYYEDPGALEAADLRGQPGGSAALRRIQFG